MYTKEGLKPIGWTAIPLFDNNYELDRGHFKIPIYETPTNTWDLGEDAEIFRKINRLGPMTAWIRLYHGDEEDSFICHPSYSVSKSLDILITCSIYMEFLWFMILTMFNMSHFQKEIPTISVKAFMFLFITQEVIHQLDP